jgi:ABC-type multidrug transport system fused ATPase/permease subunit
MITLFSSSSSGLNTSVLFTSLTILNIFMERLEIFLRQMPSIASAFGCLRRIETFLLLETKRDNRLVGNEEILTFEAADDYEHGQIGNLVFYNTIISMKELSIDWTRATPILQGVNLDIPQGNFTMAIGP